MSTRSTHSVIEIDTRDTTASFEARIHGVQEDNEQHSSPKPSFANGYVEPADSAKAAAIEWPLAMKDTWLSDEKAFYLKRSIQVWRKTSNSKEIHVSSR